MTMMIRVHKNMAILSHILHLQVIRFNYFIKLRNLLVIHDFFDFFFFGLVIFVKVSSLEGSFSKSKVMQEVTNF